MVCHAHCGGPDHDGRPHRCGRTPPPRPATATISVPDPSNPYGPTGTERRRPRWRRRVAAFARNSAPDLPIGSLGQRRPARDTPEGLPSPIRKFAIEIEPLLLGVATVLGGVWLLKDGMRWILECLGWLGSLSASGVACPGVRNGCSTASRARRQLHAGCTGKTRLSLRQAPRQTGKPPMTFRHLAVNRTVGDTPTITLNAGQRERRRQRLTRVMHVAWNAADGARCVAALDSRLPSGSVQRRQGSTRHYSLTAGRDRLSADASWCSTCQDAKGWKPCRR